ncbi:hypothetical protein [Paenibacillus whitsoniae]|uniref:Uncharacterized protein n=1 Tax=Paenibacillus whitsoniae TaxID=2496558 RepID=A0A430JBR3_9BACL|nr:hypothetical protein [Paenibacillus whitsoniae]RTE08472.1 hypothetical protein EJQ19_17410 [Paenibacillus whitsoniae]
MSLYNFIAADQPLTEIDLTGAVWKKVKEIKQMDSPPSGPVSWDELDDELEVMVVASHGMMNALQIAVCTNPPYGLEHYISKPYIYWLGGHTDEKWKTQLLSYVEEHCREITGEIELWSIWFHESVQPIAARTQRLAELDAQDLDWLLCMNRCLTLLPERQL